MKLLLLSKESVGGAGSFIRQISKLPSVSRQVALDIYLYKQTGFKLKEVNYLNHYYPKNIFLKVVYFLINLVLTFRLLRKINPDTVILADVYSQIIYWVLPLHKSKSVYLINQNYVFVLPKWVRYLHSRALLKADKVVFVSDGLAKSIAASYGLKKLKYQIIYNAVNYDQLESVAPDKDLELLIKDRNVKIMTAGRFSPQKDFLTVLEAYKKVYQTNPKVSLYILGEGEEKENLSRYILEHHLKHVHLCGWKNNLFTYLKEADIFLFSSHFEGFGRVIIEAMSCGLPVIATDSPFGPREILTPQYGLLVPVGNIERIAESMLELTNNIELRSFYERQSLQRASYFNEEKMLKQYLNLCKSL